MKIPVETAKGRIAIEAKGLSIGYIYRNGKNIIIHKGIDLKLLKGDVTCLLGLNGAGKSTLLKTLCGFQPPIGGEVSLMNRPLSSFSQSELALNLGVVLTEKTNTGGITVYELVSLGRHPYTGFFGHLKKEDHRIIKSSLEAAGIEHKGSNYVSELSDGERQKAMIAKVLAQQCPIIILDEPTAFLDVTSRIETMVLLRKLAKEQDKAILLSTHDIDSAIQMGDRLWLQSREKQMSIGTPEDLILNGSLGDYFNKDGIEFDTSVGKLNSTIKQERQIGIEGDFKTAYWVGNAMIRNGFRPSSLLKNGINIFCHTPSQIDISLPKDGDNLLKVDSIAAVIDKVNEYTQSSIGKKYLGL